MASSDSFTRLVGGPDTRSEEAAAAIVNRFTQRLIALARGRLEARVRRKVGPEDVVQSVYRSFFRRHADGQFRIEDWDGLWAMLTVITVRKCANCNQFFRADKRDVRREADMSAPPGRAGPAWEAPSREPTPEEAAMLAETVAGLMGELGARARDILALSLQGYTTEEIGEQLGRARRTVRRVRERVKNRLERMLAAAG
jgi:RNA polymerase sigma-70 factor (ECF subfamily)